MFSFGAELISNWIWPIYIYHLGNTIRLTQCASCYKQKMTSTLQFTQHNAYHVAKYSQLIYSGGAPWALIHATHGLKKSWHFTKNLRFRIKYVCNILLNFYIKKLLLIVCICYIVKLKLYSKLLINSLWKIGKPYLAYNLCLKKLYY